ncbi:MAG: HNH endonuclease [Bacteroidales bacterium]|nr:HNH endonuclease [Bacteroidales bacterium]
MKQDSIPYIDKENKLIEELNILYQKRLIKKEFNKKFKESKRIILSKEQRQRIYNKTDGLCHVCGIKLEIDNFQADHVKPFSTGGHDIVDNFLPACSQCNNYRWDYSPEEMQWILKLGVWLKTEIQKKSKEGLEVLPKIIKDEIKREKRRKNPRISKTVDIDFKDLLPVKGKLDFGAKVATYTEIENAQSIIEKYLITNIDSTKDFFSSKSFLITGETNANKKKIEELIKENGGIIKTSVSTKLDYLVIGNFYSYLKVIKLQEINDKNKRKISIILNKKIETTFANILYV